MSVKHEHDFQSFAVKKVMVCDNVDYTGQPGDFAFLTKKCKCGKVSPHDYGKTHEMEQKLERIEEN